MALTNAQVKEILSKAGVSAENIDDAVKQIMDGHITSINALREERDSFKADAEKLPELQKELGELKSKGDVDWQTKFDNEHKAFDEFKKQIANEKVLAQKAELYKGLLSELNVEGKRIDSILKVTDLAKLSVKDGKLEDAESLKEAIKNEWSGFIVETKEQGASVDNPPAKTESNAFDKMSLADKMIFANEHPTDQSVIDWLKK